MEFPETTSGLVALSSCVTNYVAWSFATCQITWLKLVFKKILVKMEEPIKMHINNKSTINLAKSMSLVEKVNTKIGYNVLSNRQTTNWRY